MYATPTRRSLVLLAVLLAVAPALIDTAAAAPATTAPVPAPTTPVTTPVATPATAPGPAGSTGPTPPAGTPPAGTPPPSAAGTSGTAARAAAAAPAGCTVPAAGTTVRLGADSAPIGGTLRVTGAGWCHPDGTGSVVAVKIDDGAYSHQPGQGPNANLTIWQVIEAGDDGTFAVDVRLPTATNSTPAFAAGPHTLRFLTGTLKAGDTIRTLQSGEFTATAAGGSPGPSGSPTAPGRPAGVPDPYDADEDLTAARRGGVSVTVSGGRLTVTVPGAAAGSWVYLYAYAGASPRTLDWYQLSAARTVTAGLDGTDLAAGPHKLAVLGRTGVLLGWGEFTLASATAPAPGGDDSGGGELAETGPEQWPAGVGLVLLLAGGSMLVTVRRRAGEADRREWA